MPGALINIVIPSMWITPRNDPMGQGSVCRSIIKWFENHWESIWASQRNAKPVQDAKVPTLIHKEKHTKTHKAKRGYQLCAKFWIPSLSPAWKTYCNHNVGSKRTSLIWLQAMSNHIQNYPKNIPALLISAEHEVHKKHGSKQAYLSKYIPWAPVCWGWQKGFDQFSKPGSCSHSQHQLSNCPLCEL